jgi:TonB family protein
MKPTHIFMIGLLLFGVYELIPKPKPEAYVALDPAQPQCNIDTSKLPATVVNPYLAEDHVFGPWIGSQDRLLQMHWEDKPFKKQLSCKVTVSKTGHLLDVQIVKTSGSPSIDQTAMDIIKEAAPFNYLPETPDHQTFLVQFRDFPTVFFRRIRPGKEDK